MPLSVRTAGVTLMLSIALAGCGDSEPGGAAPEPDTEDAPSVSYDGDWSGSMDDSGGAVEFQVDGDELEYFEAVIPACDPGYTEDKAFTLEEFEIAEDGSVDGTVEDDYAGMGVTTLAIDGSFDGETFTGTLDWQGTYDCSSEGLAFSAELQ